jgi:hypothetical protein
MSKRNDRLSREDEAALDRRARRRAAEEKAGLIAAYRYYAADERERERRAAAGEPPQGSQTTLRSPAETCTTGHCPLHSCPLLKALASAFASSKP